jgi:hypothetical protein
MSRRKFLLNIHTCNNFLYVLYGKFTLIPIVKQKTAFIIFLVNPFKLFFPSKDINSYWKCFFYGQKWVPFTCKFWLFPQGFVALKSPKSFTVKKQEKDMSCLLAVSWVKNCFANAELGGKSCFFIRVFNLFLRFLKCVLSVTRSQNRYICMYICSIGSVHFRIVMCLT